MPDGSTVFVVDDDENARDSVCVLVRSMGVRAAACASAEEFLEHYDPEVPGCLVTDIRMLGMSGIELLEELKRRGAQLPVIVITAFARTRLTVRAMAAGAITLLEKPYDDDELWDAIRGALAADLGRRAVLQRWREIERRTGLLTPGEREVMEMIVQGAANKVIAGKLGLSVRAIESRRHAIFQKMQANSLAELIRLAIEAGFDQQPAEPPPPLPE